MKKLTILTCLLFLLQTAAIIAHNNIQINPLAEYTGKYQVVQKRGTIGIKIELVNDELVCTQSWDGEKLLLRHLSGDNFIMAGFDWSVKFLRDKDKKISQILVMGTDRWDKVKE
ncbi:MAG: hypothetical protein V4577_06515 [Bacteroidota bacterium]